MKNFLLFLIYVNFILGNSVNIVTDIYKPYTDPNIENHGFLSEIASVSFKEVGIDMNLEFVPWNRASELTKKGFYDGLLGAFITEQRSKNFYFSNPIYKDVVLIYSLADSKIKIDEFSDLYNFSIGIVRGYSYSKEFDSDTAIKKESSVDSITNLNLLLNNRIDLIVESKLVTEYIMKHEFGNYDKKLKEVYILNADWLYLLFPKKSEESKSLVNKFNIGLEKIKNSKKYDEILKRNEIE